MVNYFQQLFNLSESKMDIFQFIGDLLHLIAIILLIQKIHGNRNMNGVSYKTQEIYAVVFLTRYIDIFLGWNALYLFLMKLFLTGITIYICFLAHIKKPYSLSYNKQSDSFPHYYLYGVAGICTMIIHRSLMPIELLWSYSQWLQALAILPQLLLIYRQGSVQNITAKFVFLMGLYRIFYIAHWFYSWQRVIFTSFISGVLQSLLYADFLYYFIKSDRKEKIMQIPI